MLILLVSSPLDVRVGDVLQFRCEEDDEESTVFALEVSTEE